MVKKDLCITCVHDRICSFSRRFPVLQCEEFTVWKPTVARVKKKKQARQTKRKTGK